MPETLQLRLLGRPEISRASTSFTKKLSSKAQAILYYLAVTGQPQPRSFLAGLLWSDMPEAGARANLRKALANLRQVLGEYLDLDPNEIAFKPERLYWVDVEELVAAINNPAGDMSLLQEAVDLYRGDFLSGFYIREAPDFETWVLAEQTRLHELVIQALHTLVTHHARQGELAQAIGKVRHLLSLEPWREEAHRQLMQLLAQDGQRSVALMQFEACREILAEELGVPPSPETVALYEQIRAGELSKGAERQGSRGKNFSSAPLPNLPAQATPFVGREQELADIIRRLSDKDCRLLTLVGPGGVGKTRLALQTGQRIIDSGLAEDFFADGVLFVPLVAVSTASGIATAIAKAANFNFSGNLPPKQQLLGYLQGKKLLLILDNFEHLLSPSISPLPDSFSASSFPSEAAAGELITEILGHAPEVKLLVTSREALNLQEAWFHPVEGMSYPRQASPAGEQKLETYDAVGLFVQSAQRARGQFSLAVEQAHVVRLCQLAEGMPLALELAATWLKVMPAEKISREIERGLDILTTRHQNIPERHRSMRAVFEYSWGLLTPEERNILKRLSVFRGSFDPEAAENVAGASFMSLATLVEKSLVRVTEPGRYQMHELLRQFAAEKLAQSPEEQAQFQIRHYSYYAGWLERQDALLRTEQQLEAVRRINTELENIQAAWWRAVDQADTANLSRFFWSLWFVYEAKSWFHAGVELFGEAATRLRHLGQATSSPEQGYAYAQLLAFHSRFQLRLHRLEQAKPGIQQSLPVLQQFKADRELGLALQTRGLTAWVQGHYLEARDYLEQSVASAERGGDPLVAAYSRSMTGFVAFGLGEYVLAEQLIRERLPVLRQIGKLWGLVFSLAYLSTILSALERYSEAEQLLREGLAISREVEDRWAVADCLKRLGLLLTSMEEEKREAARPLLLEGTAIFRDIDDPWGLTTTLNQLGQTCYILGDYEASQQYLGEALQLAHQSDLIPIVLDILVNLAGLRLQQTHASQPASTGFFDEAVEILSLVINHPAGEQATRDRATRLLAEYTSALPADRITSAINRSRSRILEETVTAYLRSHL